MPRRIEYQPPEFEFDDSLGDELARIADAPPEAIVRPTLYAPDGNTDYERLLTPEGGILILYKDCVRNPFRTVLTFFLWLLATVFEIYLTADWPMPAPVRVVWIAFLGALTWFVVSRKVKVSHSVEIRHDRMILDGKDVFWAERIGAHWPQLQNRGDDPNRMVIAGIYGNRWVEYMTANRVDENDRTPEVLAADLQEAMQQLWGRNELDFS
jgi:hypothetical protein